MPLAVILAGYWFMTDSGFYHWLVTLFGESLSNRGISLMLTLVVNLLGVALIVFILRFFTRDMPALRSQLQQDVALMKTPGSVKKKMEIALKKEQERLKGDPEAAKAQQRIVDIAVMTIGLALLMVGGASLLVIQDTIFEFQIALILVGIGMLIYGGVSLVFHKK